MLGLVPDWVVDFSPQEVLPAPSRAEPPRAPRSAAHAARCADRGGARAHCGAGGREALPRCALRLLAPPHLQGARHRPPHGPSHRPFAQPRLLEEKCHPRRHFSGEPPRPIPERRTGARRAVVQPPTGTRRRLFCSARCPRASSATRATSGGARRAPAPAPAAGASSTAQAQTSQSCSRSWSAPGTASAASRTSCTCTTSRRHSTTSRSTCKRSPRPAAPRRACKARSCRLRRGRRLSRPTDRAAQRPCAAMGRRRHRAGPSAPHAAPWRADRRRRPGRYDPRAPARRPVLPPDACARSWCSLSLQPSPPRPRVAERPRDVSG